MDRKSKFPQSSAKGAAIDTKKNPDVNSSKLLPRTSRKRDPTSSNNFPKYEQPKKGNAQKAKIYDKRPKPKGQYYGGAKEDSKVASQESAELGSVLVPGSKKQNLNHLLNFHYEPRATQSGSSSWNVDKSTNGYNRNGKRWNLPFQRHKYNKEQFLQASCQFVVTSNGDYSLYLTNPDILVDWKLIEQIKFYSSENLSCPICLYTPVAGKMTRCGHVYCWPCILHYLSLSEKTWHKCPICYEPIYKSDLKSVVVITQNTFNLGDTIQLHLMRRKKDSVLPTPVESKIHTSKTFFFVSENSANQIYSKLLIANVKDVIDIIECERTQLKLELMNNLDCPDNCYIEEALNELLKREEELLKNANSTEAVPMEKINIATCCKDDTKFLVEQSSNTVDNNQPASDLPKFSYFYQANDGQHVYLHKINVKMLEMQYGSLEHSPPIITGKLLEKEVASYTEESRQKLRYLRHLPLNCQFETVEIEFGLPLVSEEVLRAFREQLKSRQKRRERREREERRREKKIIEEENKRMGKYVTPDVHIESHKHFPQWQPELLYLEEGMPSPPESITTSSVASSPSLSTFDEIASIQEPRKPCEQVPSFAEMLRNTNTRKSSNAWPSVTSAQSRTYPGAALKGSSDEENGYISIPSSSQSFGDAFARAFEQTKLLESGEKDNANATKKKKKKGKGTVLHATGMSRTS